MENLIWKFIDKNCTDEEIEQVNRLLESDSDFKSMYLIFSGIDAQLSDSPNVPMSPLFKSVLQQTILTYSRKESPSKISDVLSTEWIVGLTFVAVSVLIYALNFNIGTGTFIPSMPVPNAKIMTMISLVTTGFIMLLILDWVFKRVYNRRITFILV